MSHVFLPAFVAFSVFALLNHEQFYIIKKLRWKLAPLNCRSGLIGSFLIEVHSLSPYSFLDRPSHLDSAVSLQTRPRRLAPLHCFPPLLGAGLVQVRSCAFNGMLPVIWHWLIGQCLSPPLVQADHPPSTSTGKGVFCSHFLQTPSWHH